MTFAETLLAVVAGNGLCLFGAYAFGRVARTEKARGEPDVKSLVMVLLFCGLTGLVAIAGRGSATSSQSSPAVTPEEVEQAPFRPAD